jgi:hypothetical protein
MLNVKSIILILVIVAAIAVIFFFFVLTRLPSDFIQILQLQVSAVKLFTGILWNPSTLFFWAKDKAKECIIS